MLRDAFRFRTKGFDSAPLPLKLFSLAYPPDGTRATRKPRMMNRSGGVIPLRNADRQILAMLLQLPPRLTRFEAVPTPPGSLAVPAWYGPYQSLHHSHTFPCMSYKPQALGCFCPTGCVVPLAFWSYQA